MSYDDTRSSAHSSQVGMQERSEQQESQHPKEQTQKTQYPDTYGSQSSTSNQDERESRFLSNAQRVPPPMDLTNSTASSQYNQTRQPINDIVNSAFDRNESQLSPELLNHITSQITANVLQQLRGVNLPGSPLQPQPTMPSTGDNPDASSASDSPPVDRAKLYTPPSPYRAGEEAAHTQTSQGQARSGQTTYGAGQPPKREVSPFSQSSLVDSLVDESDAKESKPGRPKGPKRLTTSDDTTIVEKAWGTLVNEQGEVTLRLGQFLRGIAVHLIEDYEPKHSLVITPDKMQKYYQDTKVPNDFYPWQIIFDDRTSSISRMYREICAQHHLVQEKADDRPDIPGLTPQGFETWATQLMHAHPDQEFERLAKTALDMPISNPDNRKERFPKELSRRLFPKDGQPGIAAKLQKAITTHCNVTFASRHQSVAEGAVRSTTHDFDPKPLERMDTITPQTSTASAATMPSSTASATRSSYTALDSDCQTRSVPASKAPSEAPLDEEEENSPTPRPLERERNPYVAQPGAGKSHNMADKSSGEKTDLTVEAAYDTRIRRSTSVSSKNGKPVEGRTRTASIAIHQKDMPDTSESHRTRTSGSENVKNPSHVDTIGGEHLSRARTYSANPRDPRDPPNRYNRTRSPSVTKYGEPYHRSDPEMQYGSYPPPPAFPGDPQQHRGSIPDHRASGAEHRTSISEHRGSVSGPDGATRAPVPLTQSQPERHDRGPPPPSYDGRYNDRDRDRNRDRDRDRESRSRYQPTCEPEVVSTGVGGNSWNVNGEDYYRQNAPGSTSFGAGGVPQSYATNSPAAYGVYPPSSYRDGR